MIKRRTYPIGKKEKKLYPFIEHMVTDSTDVCKKNIPKELRLNKCDGNKGLYFGYWNESKPEHYVGMAQNTEGNIMVIGGNGSGKSAGIVKPTMQTWGAAICATDIKGELSEYYARLFQQGVVTRPYVVFDPTQTDGPSYDPFWWLLQDDSNNLVNNIQEIALAIIPLRPDEKDPFWTETERGVLAAALLYYFQLGLSFSETMAIIAKPPISSLCRELSESDDLRVQMLLGEMSNLKDEILACIDRGLRNKIMLFAVDPYVSHVFRGQREEAVCFTWDDLRTHNIFLRIPADRIEQWSNAINLIYTQLIRYLERRPEKYSDNGTDTIQTLLLMDEFARFGKLEMISSAMSTLRSKNVNICLVVQSVAQLDQIYGEKERRIIFDNCQYQAILRANDAETQKYLADLIGTCAYIQQSVGEQMDVSKTVIGYSRQVSEVRDYMVYPHELAMLDKVLLLTPYGFCQAEKLWPRKRTETKNDSATLYQNTQIMNKGATIMSINDRSARAEKRAGEALHQKRTARRQEKEEQKKLQQRRNYIIGELVTKYFPEVREFEPGTQTQNASRFAALEAFLAVLADDANLVDKLKDEALSRISPEGYFIPTELDCVSGPH